MAITWGTPVTAIDSTGAADTISLTKPAGLADGDVLVAVITLETDASNTIDSWTLDTGWVQITAASSDAHAGNEELGCFYKVVTNAAGEAASYSFTMNGTGNQAGDIAAILVAATGVDTTTPVDATASGILAAEASTIPFPGLTTTTDSAHYVGAGAQNRSASITYDGAMTKIASVASANGSIGARITAMIGFLEVASAGVVAAQSATSNQTRDYISGSFALKPAGGGSSPSTVEATPATATLEAQPVTATPGPVSVGLTPATLTVDAQALDPQPGPVAVDLTAAAMTLTAVDITAAPGHVTTALTPAGLTLTAGSIDPAPGPVTVALTAATVTLTAVAVSIDGGPVTIDLTPAAVTLDAQPVTATPGALSVALTTATVTLTPQPVTPTPQPVTVDLTPAELVMAAVVLTGTPGPVALALTPAVLTLAAVALFDGTVVTIQAAAAPAVARWAATPAGARHDTTEPATRWAATPARSTP